MVTHVPEMGETYSSLDPNDGVDPFSHIQALEWWTFVPRWGSQGIGSVVCMEALELMVVIDEMEFYTGDHDRYHQTGQQEDTRSRRMIGKQELRRLPEP